MLYTIQTIKFYQVIPASSPQFRVWLKKMPNRMKTWSDDESATHLGKLLQRVIIIIIENLQFISHLNLSSFQLLL